VPSSLNRSAARPTVRYLIRFRSSGSLDFLLEPAQRLARHRTRNEAHEIELQDPVHKLVIELVAAAIIHPGHEIIGVPAEGGNGAEQRERLVLAVPIGGHAVAAIENAGIHGVLHLEGRNHGAGGQHFELQASAGHGRSRAWRNPTQIRGRYPWSARSTGISMSPSARADIGHRHGGGSGHAGGGEEFATIRARGIGWLWHASLPVCDWLGEIAGNPRFFAGIVTNWPRFASHKRHGSRFLPRQTVTVGLGGGQELVKVALDQTAPLGAALGEIN
jgi:hypothetical protein